MIDLCAFDELPLKVAVRGRVMPRKPYKSQEEARKNYSRQPREKFQYTLVAK
jgi:hypothetical protein